MNAMIKYTFDAIRQAYSAYKTRVADILQKYRDGVAYARERYSAAVFQQEKEALMQNARADIEAADKQLHTSVNGASLPKLRRELDAHMSAPISDFGFLTTLRTYKDLGVKMQPSEIEAFIRRADGNYAALRVLDSIARESGYKIAMPTVEDYEADIRNLRARIPMMYAPHEFIAEAKEIMAQKPIFRMGEDEALQFAGATDALDFILNAATVDSRLKGMDEMSARWSAAIVPTLEQIKEELGDAFWAEEGARIQHEKAVSASEAFANVERDYDPEVARAKGAAEAARNRAIVDAYKR